MKNSRYLKELTKIPILRFTAEAFRASGIPGGSGPSNFDKGRVGEAARGLDTRRKQVYNLSQMNKMCESEKSWGLMRKNANGPSWM